MVAHGEKEGGLDTFRVGHILGPFRIPGAPRVHVARNHIAHTDHEIGIQQVDGIHRPVVDGPLAFATTGFVTEDDKAEFVGIIGPVPVDEG